MTNLIKFKCAEALLKRIEELYRNETVDVCPCTFAFMISKICRKGHLSIINGLIFQNILTSNENKL